MRAEVVRELDERTHRGVLELAGPGPGAGHGQAVTPLELAGWADQGAQPTRPTGTGGVQPAASAATERPADDDLRH